MFTGLVTSKGSVVRVESEDGGVRLTVATPLSRELEPGASVAVNGVCLTATAVENGNFSAAVMAETLRRSALAPLAGGDAVNLELPLRADERLGGHFVQGHVDGVGTVASVEEEGFARTLTVELERPELLRYVVEKGSVAVDGVSLTVASVGGDGFKVSLIPETLERTTLGDARAGSVVNVEVDLLAKYVERLVESR